MMNATFFTASYVHRRGNFPYEWLRKEVQALHLKAGGTPSRNSCRTSRKLTYGAAQGMTVLYRLYFLLKILSSQTFTWLCYECFVSLQIDDTEPEGGEILFQQDGALPSPAMTCEIP
jgi:hypothetical protein